MTQFNTRFDTTSRLTRSLSAAAAVLSTVLVISSVVGLALHYEQNAPMQSAAIAPITPVATSATPSV
jgi:hypothetical protein